jgi:chemotaxis protein MotB
LPDHLRRRNALQGAAGSASSSAASIACPFLFCAFLPEIPWIMRVDGHTDKRPISGGPFKSNWELSAARAIAVVQYLIGKGADPQHLVAAGFGEFQPIDTGDSDEALARNRRIESKLTER